MMCNSMRTSATLAVSAPPLAHPPDEEANCEGHDAGADDDGRHIGCMVGVLGMPNHAVVAAVGAQGCADQAVRAPGRCPALSAQPT